MSEGHRYTPTIFEPLDAVLRKQVKDLLEERNSLGLALQVQDAAFKEVLDALGNLLEVCRLQAENDVDAEQWNPMDYGVYEAAESIHRKYTQEPPDA